MYIFWEVLTNENTIVKPNIKSTWKILEENEGAEFVYNLHKEIKRYVWTVKRAQFKEKKNNYVFNMIFFKYSLRWVTRLPAIEIVVVKHIKKQKI